MTSPRIQLGAPGIYRTPPTVVPRLAGERLDACAFVGVAARGPAYVPVIDERWRVDQPTVGLGRARRRSVARRVTSWAEFEHIYGGLRGPGRLPWAVRSFFDQGGVEAWIVRITAPVELDACGDPRGIGRAPLPFVTHAGAPLRVFARDEGAWSQTLALSLGFARAPQGFVRVSATGSSFAIDEAPAAGSLLRASFDPPGSGTELRFVTGLVLDRTAGVAHASLSAPWSAAPERLELVSAQLWLDDGDGRRELHRELGLSALHPRWLATVLSHESALAFPDPRWVEALGVEVDAALPRLDRTQTIGFVAGHDRYAAIEAEHFFDPAWDPRGERPGEGLAALADAPEVASVVVPDLYHPQALRVDEDIRDAVIDLGSADWTTCLEREPPTRAPDPVIDEASDCPELEPAADPKADRLPGLIRDVGSQLEQIIASQRAVVAMAEQLRVVALLDVPPGLDQRRMLVWRQHFASSWAAAYHPWLRLAPTSAEPEREVPMRIGPAAVAAGLIARREIERGIPHGPANELSAGVVAVEDPVSPRRHDELHTRGINVFLRERDGVRLTGGRTLSGDPRVRQLSVRRLVQLLHRSVQRQLQWVVFEGHDAGLRLRLREHLRLFLRDLYSQGAFAGAREDEAFFVRCDASNNPAFQAERGELLAEIGVAPAEPIEFIVLALHRVGDQLEVTQR